MTECPPLPTALEFEAECANYDVRLDPLIARATSKSNVMFTPHPLLQALATAVRLLREYPSTPLYEGDGQLPADTFTHASTRELACIINGSKSRHIPEDTPMYNFRSFPGQAGVCGLAEGFFARTVLSWDDNGQWSAGDIIVDEASKALMLRKHRTHGQGSALVLAEGMYMDSVPCPPGMIVQLETNEEQTSNDYLYTTGPMRILPIKRFLDPETCRFSMQRLSMYGLPESERALVMKHAKRGELLLGMNAGEKAFTEQQTALSIGMLAEYAVGRAMNGEIRHHDLR